MADRNDASLTVSAYSQKFFQSYSDSIEPSKENVNNNELAGKTFINLVKKLYEAGSKEDIKVPLRVLRDEIGRIYFGSVQQRDLRIEKLFQLYDALEEGAQEEIRTKSVKEAAWAQQALEELRQRFSRLVIGDTWEAYPELKLKALHHMNEYAAKEKADKQNGTSTPVRQGPAITSSNRLGMKKLSRSFSGTTQPSSTWQSTFDDLGKAPGARLLPLIKLLITPSKTAPAAVEAAPEAVSLPGTPVNEAQHKDPLRSQASGISEGGLGRPMSELDINMDDLLGLNESPFEANKADPFRASFDEQSSGGNQSTAAQPHQQAPPVPKQAAQPTNEYPRQAAPYQPDVHRQTYNPSTNNIPPPSPVYSPTRQQRSQNGAPSQFAGTQAPLQDFNRQTSGPFGGYQNRPEAPPQDFNFNRQTSGPYPGYQTGQEAPPRDFSRQTSGAYSGYQSGSEAPHRDVNFNRQTSGPYTGYQTGPEAPPRDFHRQSSGAHSGYQIRPEAPPQDFNFSRQTSGPYTGSQSGSEAPPRDINFSRQTSGAYSGYQSGPQMASVGSGSLTKIPHNLGSIGTSNGGNPGSFNPFDLPSPTYASPVPKHVDNSFAEFSPVAGAPLQPRIPNPMRNPPEPPKGVSSPTQGGPQPPRSTFSSW